VPHDVVAAPVIPCDLRHPTLARVLGWRHSMADIIGTAYRWHLGQLSNV
jgi:hypothetical protein